MKLNPQQAPLYGECVLTVQLDDDDVCRAEGEDEEEEEAEFYLLFSGSTQRHLSSTLRVSHVTLQAVCPAHNVCEQVLVTLCLARPGAPVDTHSRETFCFVQDLALDMAHFLLDNISPQEAFLLDDEQIGLKECERLDQSLALALKYLSLPPQRTGPALDTQTTHTPAHSGTDGDDTETQQEATAMDVSTLLDSCTGRSQCQQLSSLLHVAASHGLRTVAALVLQQPGGREALRTPDAQGQTAAAVARSRGHQQLLQLFTQYETSSNVQVELKEQPHVYPEGRVFQHHAALGTYTLTFPGLGQRGGGGEDRCIQEELKELRRRIGLHRDTQGNSSGAAALSPACRQQPCEQNAGLSAVTIETCSTTTEEQGSPPSLEERARGEDSAVTQTSCSSASLCQSQEAANSPASRNRKNKRRGRKTTRRAAESPGSNRGTPEVGGGIARRPTKATGSGRETDGATSPRASVTAQRGPATEETPLPRKPGSASGTDGKCAGRKAAALSTAIIVEKQEVDLLMCERVAETETVTRTEQGDTGRLPAGQADVKFAVESAAERTVTMGQEQSQDPQESQPGSEEPSQADTTDNSPQSGRRTSPKSPDSDRKPRRGLWRDGGWIGSRMGSIPQGPETVAKTVWYQGENLDQGASEAWKNSQSVWYDGDTTDQRTHEQLEQGVTKQKECDWSSAQASGLSSQVSAALSQPHAAGTQPALSQGPGAQRREVHGSQPEEEVGPDWKEGGVEGDGEEVTNRETSYSRQSSERADTEEGGEEKQGSQEKAAKSRKKRRNKRGKRGGAEGKLSSSSSIESQSRIEIKTDLKTQSETESEARDRTGRAEGKSPTQREETDKDAMLLPSQTEGQTRGAHGPDSPSPSDTPPDFSPADLTESTASQTPETKELSEDSKHFHGPDHFNPDSSVAASELGQMDIRKADVEDITAVQPVKKEVLDPTELELKGLVSPVQQTVDNVESNPLSENEDLTVAGQAVTSVDRTGLVDSDCPREIPFKLSDPTEFTENSFLVEFPVDPKGRPVGFMESVRPAEAGGLPSEGTADVLPLQIREGSAETTARGYSEHCLVSEMLRDQQHTDEKRNELWVGKEEAAKKRRRREENGSGMHRRELSSIDGEQEQDFNENLVGTAVAVVAVAIASAVASLELSQQLADSQSERQGSEDLLNTVQASQLMDTDRCPPVPCETGQQPVEHSRPTDRFPSQQAANVEISEVALECDTETGRLPAARLCYNQPAKLDLFVHADTPSLPHLHKEEIQKETTQNKVFTRSPPKEEEDGLLRVTGKPLPKANQSITSEVDGGGPVQVDVQLQHPEASEENPTPGELRGPQDQSVRREERGIHDEGDVGGQPHEQDSPHSSECQQDSPHSSKSQQDGPHSSECQQDGPHSSKCQQDGPHSSKCQQDGPHSSKSQQQDGPHSSECQQDGPHSSECQQDGPHSSECQQDGPHSSECQQDGPHSSESQQDGPHSSESQQDGPHSSESQQQDSPHSSESQQQDGPHSSESQQDGPHSSECQQDSPPRSESLQRVSDCQDKEQDRDPQLEAHLKTSCEGDIPTLSLPSCSTLPVTPRDSTLAARPGPEEPPAPVNVETGEYQSSQASADRKLVPAGSSTGPESVAMDTEDALDAVDGWKDRERNKMKSEEKVPVDVPSQTAEEEEEEAERQLTGRPPDGTHPLHIQRERDAFCPEANTVPTCSDVSEECVPVCLLHKEDSVQLDNSVFKKPKAPPPCVGHRDRGAGVSLSPSEGALSVDTPDAVAPRSSRLAWKSQTEDRGGGGGGGGEEEENKDQLSDSPVSSSVSRASIRSLSPFRRHSWEPRRNNGAADVDITQRSSMKSLSEEVRRAKPPLHRRSMSWCPSTLLRPDQEQTDNRSYSLEALRGETGGAHPADPQDRTAGLDGQHSGSLVSLTEEEQDEDSQTSHQVLSATNSYPAMFHHQTLTKSISMVAISHRDIDAVSSFSSNSGTLEYSISEEEPGPLRSDTEGKGGPKISRTFSYLRSKMSKKGKEKEKERKGEKARESKEREKKSANGHLFILVSSSPSTAGCQHCSKALPSKESFLCSNCGASVHKSCRESLSVCTKSKTKQQTPVPEAVPGSAVNMRSKSTSSASSVSSASSSSSRERWTTAASPDDQFPVLFPRRHPSIFNTHSNLAKSISTSNIAGLDDVPLKGLKFLSQSTDSLHQGSKVNASTESLTDEGTEMMDSQLMGEFEWDVKDLEADSWSGTMDKKFLKTLKKDEIKKQDVIYELYQTEFHHVRTLKIMSDVYYKGLQKELQLDSHTLDKIFPVMDDLLDTHTHFLTLLLERKRASSTEAQKDSSFLICSIGDVLLSQFSGCSADRMKKVYGKFCSRHNEAVNLYKDLHAKDKRFQAFIKRTMSSSIVRRLSIPECILLVTQRITKYPVLIQRILQHTKDSDSDHGCVCDALRCVKQLITAVDSKVNEQEKKQRLREVYSRTDSKSIMRMKSGQMFAKEDLIRGRKMLHDGALQLKNSAGRLKDVQALLLSDVLVFLQEKDQKYVFASLDQRSTVISLQNLIVREVANEERGLFLITAGTERPEMVEVLASSKEERNTWRAIIQDAMHCMEKDEDEGVPSETEEDRRQQENRAKEIRELLRRKDEQILALLEEKVHIFRELGDWSPAPDDPNPPIRERMLFMATPDEVTKGEPIIKDALREVESLQGYVSSGVGVPAGLAGGASAGPVCLPRRAETFGGFDSHQMSSSKNGEKEEGDESLDLRRTESDSVLKKGGTASLQMLLKRNTEVLHSVTHLHELLIALQAVVLQQDSFIEDQRQNLSDRLAATSSRHSSSSSLSSTSSSRPSSLIEQEKHRSLERQRQEAATLQKQQAAHQEEKRRREKAWELKEKSLAEREERLRLEEEQTKERRRQLTEEGELLLRKKEEYQAELERLKEAQRTLESEQEALRRDAQRLEAMNTDQSEQLQRYQRTPSTTSEDSIRFHSSGSLDLDSKEAAEQPKGVEVSSSAPSREPFLRIGSKRMGKSFNPFSSTSSSKPQGAEKESQLPSKLLQLSKTKEKKDKRNKKGKGEQTQTESNVAVMSDPRNDGDIFFC
ncbi:A-kinase anchor protein 13 isoform X4 [Perca fluviatilis]|uniref:A-kinase anchor protein 13 isoform X4 n=1 Tax=Perca fluviatilis TaxID=8168 RepID=UPI001965E9E8|nr:A-kinase anchor protein 13 isoform X4 [Perca fluviatilis]